MGVIQGAMIGFAIALLVASTGTTFRKPARIDDATGAFILEHGSLMRGIGLVLGIGMPIIVIVLMFIMPFRSPVDVVMAGGVLLFFALVGGFVLLEAMLARITIHDHGIVADSAWRKRILLRWEDIAEVSYSASNKWFVVLGNRGGQIRVSLFLRGIGSFVRSIKKHISQERYGHAARAFDWVEKRTAPKDIAKDPS